MRLKKIITSEFYLNNKELLLAALIFLIVGMYIIISNNYRDKALEHSKMTWSVVQGINSQAKMGKSLDIFYFNEKNQKVEIDNIDPPSGCTGVIGENDTIFIRYSLLDNDVVEIIECFWNERLKQKMN